MRPSRRKRCALCGTRDATGWTAPDDLWRLLVRPGVKHVCRRCFTTEAIARGYNLSWEPIVGLSSASSD